MPSTRKGAVWFALGLAAAARAQKTDADPNLDTPAKQARAAEALASIKNLSGWDSLTSKHYLALVQFDPKKEPAKQEAMTDARKKLVELEAIRAEFARDFPLPEGHEPRLVVVHLFGSMPQRLEYEGIIDHGGGRYGSDPARMTELQRLMQGGDIAGNTRAAWCAYAYELCALAGGHDWFQLACGTWYARFQFDGGKLTRPDEKVLAYELRGHKEGPADVDLLKSYLARRGPDGKPDYRPGILFYVFVHEGARLLGKEFDPAWAKIPVTYARALAETKNPDKAHEAAFGAVDWKKLGAAWVKWLGRFGK
jgi:hypothetical protein